MYIIHVSVYLCVCVCVCVCAHIRVVCICLHVCILIIYKVIIAIEKFLSALVVYYHVQQFFP